MPLHSSRAAIQFFPEAPGGLSRTFGDSFAYLDGFPRGLENHFRPGKGVYTFETPPFLLNFSVRQYYLSGGCRFHQKVLLEVVPSQNHGFGCNVKFNDATVLSIIIQEHDGHLIIASIKIAI